MKRRQKKQEQKDGTVKSSSKVPDEKTSSTPPEHAISGDAGSVSKEKRRQSSPRSHPENSTPEAAPVPSTRHSMKTAFLRKGQAASPSSISNSSQRQKQGGLLLVAKEALTNRAHHATSSDAKVAPASMVLVGNGEINPAEEGREEVCSDEEEEEVDINMGDDGVPAPPSPLAPDTNFVMPGAQWVRPSHASSSSSLQGVIRTESGEEAAAPQDNESGPGGNFQTPVSSAALLVASPVVEDEEQGDDAEYRRRVREELINEAVHAQVVVAEEEEERKAPRSMCVLMIVLLVVVSGTVITGTTLLSSFSPLKSRGATIPTMAPSQQTDISAPSLHPTSPPTKIELEPTMSLTSSPTTQPTSSPNSTFRPTSLLTFRPTSPRATVAPSMPTPRPSLRPTISPVTAAPTTPFAATTSTSWIQQAKLVAFDRVRNDGFGDSVKIRGNTMVVGALADGDKGNASGSVYVFSKTATGWELHSKLTADDGAERDYFGHCLALDDETIVIGAPGGQGAVYIFGLTAGATTASWTQQAKIEAPDGSLNGYFGFSLALDGDTLVVGDSEMGDAWIGAAYVYVRTLENGRTNWTLQAKLTASDGEYADQFGISVAIDGNTVVVGAYHDNDKTGSAYVFVRETTTTMGSTTSTSTTATKWSQEAKLTAGDGKTNDWFGYTVDVDGNRIVVGAHNDDGNRGSVYVFERTYGGSIDNEVWTQQAKLRASDGMANDWFGRSVELQGNALVVGAPGVLGSEVAGGAAYVFVESPLPGSESSSSNGGWIEHTKLAAADGENGDQFGWSVSFDKASGIVTIGAFSDDLNAGSTYLFVVEERP